MTDPKNLLSNPPIGWHGRAEEEMDRHFPPHEPTHPLAEEPVLDNGTWLSPKGTPFTGVDRVDLDLLAQAYAAETDFDIPEPKLDPATRNAWRLGYRNPRSITSRSI